MAAPPPPPATLLARYRQLAPNASIKVSPLALGAMNFGESMKGHMGECTKETAFEILDTFVAAGGNFIDCANNYQNGESEVWIGEWMASRKNRDSMVIATKYGSTNKLHDPKGYPCQSNWGGAGTKSMKKSLEESLAKLQTSYVDILYLHWWDYVTPIPEVMQSLNDLVIAGKVHYLGISDTPAWIVSKANQYARDHGLRPFVVYQGFWNAATRDLEREILPMCRDEGMGICVWGTLGQGKFQTAASFAAREKSNPGRKGLPITADEIAVSAVLEAIAGRKGVSIQSVALAYCMAKAPYVFPIVGSRKVEHLKANIKGLSLRLSKADINEIEEGYEFNPGFPHTFLSGAMFGAATSPTKGAFQAKDVWMTKFQGAFDWVEVGKAIQPAEE